MPGSVGIALLLGLALPSAAGQAAASSHQVTPAAAGDISTIAGGPGGPGPGSQLHLSGPCGLATGPGRIYLGDGPDARALAPSTDQLSVVAGTGVTGPSTLGGRATSTNLAGVCMMAVDQHGNLLIASTDNGLIEAVAHQTGRYYQRQMTAGHIYRVAGGGSTKTTGGLATRFGLDHPEAVTVDAAGNLILTAGNRIFAVAEKAGKFYGKSMIAGHIYPVAGTGRAGSTGDGGPALKAQLALPKGVAVDGAGNLVLAEYDGQRIRVVAESTGTFYGQPMTAGHIYTVAGTGTEGSNGDGGPATSALLSHPDDVAVDGSGNLVIADTGNNRVRAVAVRAGTFYGQSMTPGDIYTIAGTGTYTFSGDGGPATSAGVNQPESVTFDGSGNLLIADHGNYRVRVVAASAGTFYRKPMTAGDIYTAAGQGSRRFDVNGQLATRAQFVPTFTATDPAGDLAIVDQNNARVYLVPAHSGSRFGKSMTAGHIYPVAGTGTNGFSGNGALGTKAKISDPLGAAIDGSGNVVFTDAYNERVRVVAASTGTFYGKPMTAGHIYALAGTGAGGFSGDGGPATQAELGFPDGVAVDAAGNVLIADTYNDRVRVVAESTGTFYGQPMTAGDIYTIAGNGVTGYSGDGGPATQASLGYVGGVAIDGSGNVVIADSGNDVVRVVAASTGTLYGQDMTAGDIYTVAGNGTRGFSGDGGPATQAEFQNVSSVAVDNSGNLVIADYLSDRVRAVAQSTGTFYGQPMTAGDIYTVAGNGQDGFSGNGGPATRAELYRPESAASDGAGNLVIDDEDNFRVREVSG